MSWADLLALDAPGEAAWARLHASDPRASPFQHPRLALALVRVFRPARTPMLLTAADASGAWTALLPVAVEPRRVMGLSRDLLGSAMSWHASLTESLVVRDTGGAHALMQRMLETMPAGTLCELRGLPVEGHLASAARDCGLPLSPDGEARAIALDTDEPLMSGSRTRKLRQLLRREAQTFGSAAVERLHGTSPEWDLVAGQFADWHVARWAGTDTPSPLREAATRERWLAWWRASRDDPAWRVLVLRRGARIDGALLCFAGGGRWHAWRVAYGEDVRRASPGIQLVAEACEHARREGQQRLELGRGTEAYKDNWTTQAEERVCLRLRRDDRMMRLAQRLGALVGRRALAAWHLLPGALRG